MYNTVVPTVSMARPTGGARGFTLLELLVTVVLIAMITVVLAMGLRLGVAAWQRGENEGPQAFLGVAFPRLLERQLECTMQYPGSLTGGKAVRFPFCGKEHALSFFSTYSPMGSSLQGVLRITYRYDPEKQCLFLYEQVITTADDLRDELNPFSEEWNGELKPLSEMEGVGTFDLRYSGRKTADPTDEDQWKTEWPCNSPVFPAAIGVSFRPGKEKKRRESLWYFHVGEQRGS